MPPSLRPLAAALVAACAPAPPDVRIDPARPDTEADLVATATDGDVSWAWTVDGRDARVAAPRVPADRTARGQRWEARATDRRGGVGAAAVTIGNAPPRVTVTLPPTRTGEDMVAAADAADPDGDAVTLRWSWTRDGAPTAHAGPRVAAEELRRGEAWRVVVVPADGEGEGSPAEATVLIGDGPPTAVVGLRPALPGVADDVYAEASASDPDGDDVTVRYTWTVDGVAVSGDGARLPAGTGRRGQVVAVEVTPSDSVNPGPSARASVTLVNTPPEAEAAQLPSTLTAGGEAACAPLGWRDEDGDPEGWRFLWTVNDQPAPGAATLPAAQWRRDDRLRCAAVPWDGFDEGTPAWSAEITVSNTPPSLDGAQLTPARPTVLSALAVIPLGLTDPDGDDTTLDVRWEVGGVEAATLRVLPAGVARRGDLVRAEVTAHDDLDAAPPVWTDTVEIANAPPVARQLTLTPDPPFAGVDLVATATADDPEGDPVGWTFTWTLDGATLPVLGDTLPAGLVAEGDVLAVTATPSDPFDVGAAIHLAPRTAVDAPPILRSVRVDPPVLTETSVATCRIDLLPDAEDTPATLGVVWTVNGRVAGADLELDGRAFDRFDEVRCVATAEDGIHAAVTVASPPVVVANTPARWLGARWARDTLTRRDPPSVAFDGVEDPDPGDTWTYRVQWQVDGALVAEGDTLDPALFARGDAVVATLVLEDDVGEGEPAVLSPLVVDNAPPALLDARIEPAPAYADSPLRLVVTVDDPDFDPVEVVLAWQVGGVDAEGEADGTLQPGPYRRGDLVRAVGVPDDGLDSGPATEVTARIANRPPPAPEVFLAPHWPASGLDGLRCRVVAEPFDADGDRVTWRVAWSVDGRPWPGPGDPAPASVAIPGDSLSPDDVAQGERWSCTVTPADLQEEGPPASATTTATPRPLARLASGDDLACGLDPRGRTRCWGLSDDGEAPPPGTSASAISLGDRASCAITPSLACSGDLEAPPPGLFVSAAVGASHACGLRSNGQLVCWGDPSLGAPPAGASWVSVVSGRAHACALDAAGLATCWGDRGAGALSLPAGPWSELAAGGDLTCALDPGGAATCVGAPAATPPSGRLHGLTVGQRRACALDAADGLVCWGEGGWVEPGPWVEVSAGASHVCAVAYDGSIRCWGGEAVALDLPPGLPVDGLSWGLSGACALAPTLRCTGEVGPWPDGAAASAMVVGDDFGCLVDPGGSLSCWGTLPAPPPLSDVVRLTAGARHVCALTATGELACWGDDDEGQSSPPAASGWQDVAAADDHACGLSLSGQAACWGDDDERETLPPADLLTRISTSAGATCALTPSGELRCWGRVSAPPSGPGWVDVAAGDAHACALDVAGAITCWGDDAFGQLHPPAGAWAALTPGALHTCALDGAGDARCWGLIVR